MRKYTLNSNDYSHNYFTPKFHNNIPIKYFKFQILKFGMLHLFTKSILGTIFEKLVHNISLHRLREDLYCCCYEGDSINVVFFVPLGFSRKVFIEATLDNVSMNAWLFFFSNVFVLLDFSLGHRQK